VDLASKECWVMDGNGLPQYSGHIQDFSRFRSTADTPPTSLMENIL